MRQWRYSSQKVSEDISTDQYRAEIIDLEVPVAGNEICKIQYRPNHLAVIIYRGGNIHSRIDIPHDVVARLKKMGAIFAKT